ncbi:MAG: hypothetical protein JWR74_3196 [Polaromonas sp.]|nr:hypothetical protein [Polaromonas sp.]
MTAQARVAAINTTLQALQSGWPAFLAEIDSRIESQTARLVQQESEQVRGRILALRELRDMPETLSQERDSISAALADEAAAN